MAAAQEGRRLAVTGAIGFTLKLAGSGLTFAAAIALARMLGPRDFGLYSVAFASASLAGTIAGQGLPLLATRAVASYLATDRWEALRGLLRDSAARTLTWATVVAAVGALAGLATTTSTGLAPTVVLLAAACVPLASLNALRAGVVRGLGHPILADAPEQLVQPITLLSSVGIAFLAAGHLTPSICLAIQWLSAAVALAAGYAILLRVRPASLVAAPRAATDNEWMHGAWSSLAVVAGALFESQLSLYMLGWLRSASDAGHFQAARQVMQLVSLGLVAITLPLQAKLSAAWARGDLPQAQSLTTAAARVGFGFALAAAAVLVPLAGWILRLYGPDYEVAANALRILLAGQLVNAAAGPCGVVLGMTGHIGRAPGGILIAVLLNSAVGLLAIPALGPAGAAIASATGMAAYNLVWARRARRSTGLITPVTG